MIVVVAMMVMMMMIIERHAEVDKDFLVGCQDPLQVPPRKLEAY